MSNSIFVNWFLNLYKKLEIYYENSFAFKILGKITELGKNSVIVKFITYILTSESDGHVKENSKIYNLAEKFLNFVHKIFKSIFEFLKRKSDTSFICTLVKDMTLPLKNLGILANAVSLLGIGFFFIRLIVLTIRFGFDLKILIVNGVLLLIFLGISFINSETLDTMVKDNVIAKLIKWFFVE